jgi:hypothetical protein
VKKALCFTLTLFTFMTFTFLPNSLAQNSRPVVRLIYFLPSDRQPQKDMDAKFDTLIKKVQRIFADEMVRHGFGRKTFRFESKNGTAVVHYVRLQFPDAYYQENFDSVWDEIPTEFDLSKNFYVASLETASDTFCGLGAANSNMGGRVLIPSSSLCFGTGATTHELGHALGLDHDFRNNLFHLSYGADWEKDRFSRCAAEWFAVHRVFNPVQPVVDTPATILIFTPVSVGNAIRFRFEVTDPNGLHQAQLRTNTTDDDPAPGTPKLIDCKSLSGESRTVEFVTTLLTQKNQFVFLIVMDSQGNFTRREIPIDIAVLKQHSKVVSIPDPNLATGGQKIENWLWVIAPTGGRSGSNAAASGIDFLAIISGGTVTENEVATKGAKAGNRVGDKEWTIGEISPTGFNNINDMVNATGLGVGDVNYHVAYGSVALESPREQNTTMFVGSDDAVKVWLNGKLVHDNPVDRGANDYQDVFPVMLEQGKNVLLVAVYDGIVDWSGFFGLSTDTEYTVLPPETDVIEVLQPVEDINSDGVVNILDLVRVASNFGEQGENTADVNGDGVVNVLDLVQVAAAFGNI